MNPIRFEFSSIYDENLIISLGNLLGIAPVDGVLKIPPAFGSGSIVRKELDNGLLLICWDFQLNADVIFAKQLTPLGDQGRRIAVNYLIDADNITMESPSLRKKFTLKGNLNILFLPDDVDLNFELKAGTFAKVVTVCVKPGWLTKETDQADPAITGYVHKLLHSDNAPVFIESSTPDEFRIVGDVLKKSLDIPKGILNLKPRMMTLVADFFSRIHSKPIEEVFAGHVMYYQKIMEVEDILKEYVEKPLPNIDTIARMVTLSVSTLKRHFKVVHGKGVYEYYLEIKMEHAKRLLMEKSLSVNEVAFMLNYEKVSSFIEMFKKHQGFSPGSLRRKAS